MSKNITLLISSLYTAFHSSPPDIKTIIEILSVSSKEDRQKIRSLYKKTYFIPIQKDITDYLSSNFIDICLALLDTQYEFDARELHKALHSFLNDDKVICEIMSSRNKNHLSLVDRAYNNFFGISLKDEIQNETNQNFSKLLIAIIETERNSGLSIKEEEARKIAEEIKKNGIKDYEKNVDLFKELFIKKSREDLILISRGYYELFSETLYSEIKKGISGIAKKLMKGILFSTISPAEYFAKKIYKGIKGPGIDIRGLIRAMIFEEKDMENIRYYYFSLRNVSLSDDIRDNCKGSYGDILYNFVNK